MNRDQRGTQATGLMLILFGFMISLGLFGGGYFIPSIIVFILSIVGGGYLIYYPYKTMTNLIASPEPNKDVYYDDKGLYYNVRGKPYLFTWDEVVGYEVLTVYSRDDNVGVPPIFRMIRYHVWKKIDPEYALTGIMQIATVRFFKKDGTSIILLGVLNPNRLIPLFEKYVYLKQRQQGQQEITDNKTDNNADKKSYHI
jgi:hypothetical protein